MTEKITREEIEALLKLAGAATPLDLSTAQKVRDSDEIVCPTCDGDGCVPAKDWCNIDGHAIGIQVYGIGDQMAAMENFVYAANPAVIKALCTLALQAEAMQPRPMSEFPPLGPTVVSQVAYVTNGKHYGEAVRSHDEPRWVWTQTRHWCDPQPTHFYSLTSLPEPRR